MAQAKGDTNDASLGATSFPDIGTEHDDGERFFADFKTREEAEAAFKDLTTKVDGFSKQVAEAQARERAANERIDRLIMSPPGQAAQQQNQPQLETLPELPNFADDPTKFAEVMEQRVEIKQRNAEKVRASKAASGSQDPGQALEARFTRKYPALVKHPQMLRGFVEEEVREMVALGQDPAALVKANPDRFCDIIADKAFDYIKGNFGVDLKDQGQGEGDGQGQGENAGQRDGTPMPTGGDQQQQQQQTQANRTAGVAAGSQSTGGGKGDGGGLKPGSLLTDIRAIQDESGFY